MPKSSITIGSIIGYFIIGTFLMDVYMYWNVDVSRVMFAISGALGWACFLHVRSQYHSLIDMLDGATKKIKDKINDAKS